jgi:hypothetical protein
MVNESNRWAKASEGAARAAEINNDRARVCVSARQRLPMPGRLGLHLESEIVGQSGHPPNQQMVSHP